MTEQHIKIDVPAIIRGMDRITREKREIAIILTFLAPHLIEMAQAEYSRRVPPTKNGAMRHETILDLIVVGDPSNGHIRIMSNSERLGGSSFSYPPVSIGYYWGDSEVKELFMQIPGKDDYFFRVEGMPGRHVGSCHALLALLIEKALEAYPDVLPKRLKVFYEAAERSTK